MKFDWHTQGWKDMVTTFMSIYWDGCFTQGAIQQVLQVTSIQYIADTTEKRAMPTM